MAADLESLFTRGGKDLLDLLLFCVYSMSLEPLFACFVRDYRQAATAPRALALYDGFCSLSAAARFRAAAVLEPFDLRLARVVSILRKQRGQLRQLQSPGEGNPIPPPFPIPAPCLFDNVVENLRQGGGVVQSAVRGYDPAKSPVVNLPGGRFSQGQRFFLEKVWQARLRLAVVKAGFSRAATIGG